VKTSTLVALALALLLGGTRMMGQVQRIGYVNSAKIFDELPEAKDATKQLERFAKPVQDSLAQMQRTLQDKVEEYQKKEAMMSDAGKRAAQQELQDMQQRARDYAQTKDQELAKQREKILNPLKEKILRAIERIAKAEKYNFVLDQNEQINILLYADVKEDLTNRVLDNLKRGK
jgi:outer membrane protein